MKKLLALIMIAAAVLAGLRYFSPLSSEENSREKPFLTQNDPRATTLNSLVRLVTKKETTGSDNVSSNSDHIVSKQAHQDDATHFRAKNENSLQEILSKRVSSATSNETLGRDKNENAPSIGTIKVLGHRGCDTNTQGWFLSVGTPEQYNFTVSEDGETVEVEPNTPNLTGNFEFIHCADQRQFIGKRVRLTVAITAQGVTDTAQLRLRGENPQREAILNEETKVGGTYDWKDFSVETEVGPEVTLFSYGLTFRSAGKLRFSHPVFSVIE
jgi:hypothetical protein